MNYLLDFVPTTSNQPVNEDEEDNLSESESESETDHFTMTVCTSKAHNCVIV